MTKSLSSLAALAALAAVGCGAGGAGSSAQPSTANTASPTQTTPPPSAPQPAAVPPNDKRGVGGTVSVDAEASDGGPPESRYTDTIDVESRGALRDVKVRWSSGVKSVLPKAGRPSQLVGSLALTVAVDPNERLPSEDNQGAGGTRTEYQVWLPANATRLPLDLEVRPAVPGITLRLTGTKKRPTVRIAGLPNNVNVFELYTAGIDGTALLAATDGCRGGDAALQRPIVSGHYADGRAFTRRLITSDYVVCKGRVIDR